MPDTTRKRRRLYNLHKRNPNCHWCGKPTILKSGYSNKSDAATLDHLNSRYNFAVRLSPNPNWEERTVLACYQCNNDRCGAVIDHISQVEQKNK